MDAPHPIPIPRMLFANCSARRRRVASVSVPLACWRPGHGVQIMLPPAWHCRSHIAQLPRYAWAERAKTVGYPERFAQEALGHNSKAVHRAYAKRALMKIPSLED